jgi:ribosome biogenesis GTPase / thiamine phosphate phosphatase
MTDSRQPTIDDRRTGTVLQAQGGVYEIETPQGVVAAVLRGRLKREETRPEERRLRGRRGAWKDQPAEQEERSDERVAVGDRVVVEPVDTGSDASWVIRETMQRRSALSRRAPGKAPRPKTIVANVDQVVIVFAVAHPAPHMRMLDRFLVLCESQGLEPVIIANKIDLLPARELDRMFAPYLAAGYPVLRTSVKEGVGINALHERVCGRLSALTGPSGVGKSSLLNALQPGLGLRIGTVSEAVQKGRHTTVTARLIPLECGGYLADTPGLRELGLWGVDDSQLDACFPEFRPFIGSCRYGTSCTHTHEPECAVREAVEGGEIDRGRYDSYVRILSGDPEL